KATVSLYDKRTTRQTSGLASGTPMAYEEWGARVFSGEVEVKDGIFEASFILSKEFDLSVGYGRLTAYAEGDDGRDAMGSADDILVGGVADVDLSDSDGPAIKVWVDYERDADGNKLSDTPYLHAAISDEQGINTSGMGVGHDISLVIDDDRAGAISLNNYFAYDVGSHTSGTLAYPLTLVAGKRVTLTLKAWDNLNNSSSVSILVDLTGEAEWSVLTSLDPGSLSIGVKTDAPAAEADIVATLYSLTGRKVASGRFTAPLRNGLSAASLPLGSLTAGVYVLYCEVSAGGKSSTISKKILIKAQ
ncbi:hypothetical protein NP234_24950, partial [Salmonella enterica]|nr:hypothetical protein [Salmonella enterica]